MSWIQIKIQTEGAQAQALTETLMSLGAVSATMEDSADQPLLEPPPGATPIWDDTTVSGLFEAGVDTDLLTAALKNAWGTELPIKVEALEDKDWVRAWMDDFKPMQFGERLWVVPSWCEAPDPGAVNLALDPGLAFGTGTHETTALCLGWLDSQDLSGKTVVDFGCGSGILAIAAALLGAERVVAIDNDPQALAATRDNATRNGVVARIEIYAPEVAPPLMADVVVANILAGPLIQLSTELLQRLRPGGAIALSGILGTQQDEVLAAYDRSCPGMQVTERGDWIRLSGEKRV